MRSHKKRPLLPVIIILILAVFLLSGPYHEADPAVRPFFGTMRVRLSSGTFPMDTEELTTRVIKSDIELLDNFTRLKYADFTGSSCTEEISRWSARHPEVRLLYTVTMPDGTRVSSNTKELDIRSVSHSKLSELRDILKSFTEVESVLAGNLSGRDGGLEYSDLAVLRELFPNAELDFSLTLLGQEIRHDTESIDLSTMGHGDTETVRAVLSCLTKLKTVELGRESDHSDRLTLEDVAGIGRACPNARLNYSFTLYGKEVTLSDTELDFSYGEIEDEGEAVRTILPLMTSCRTLDMDSAGVSHEAMAVIRDENPNVNVVWRVWFGDNYSVRTDVERILASMESVGGVIYDADVLKYCTKVKYLDLGHNPELHDGGFIRCMPELEVLIIAMDGFRDISFLDNCPKLEYLEIFSTDISDLTPLADKKNLRHLNICCMPKLTDISPLYELPDLERLWIGSETPIPAEQVEHMKSVAPYCEINTTVADPTLEGGWRFTRYDPEEPKYWWVPRYELLREQIGYNYQEYSFYWLDPKCREEAPAEYKGRFGKEVYGL